MWSSPKLLKITIRSKGSKITIPVPLMVFYELSESLLDLFAILSFVVPNTTVTINKKKYQLKSALKMVNHVLMMLRDVKYCEPFDFVDIESGENIVKISLK